MENYKTFPSKSGCCRIKEVVVHKRFLFGILDSCSSIGAGRVPVVVTLRGFSVVSKA